jgi:hypothetical protein
MGLKDKRGWLFKECTGEDLVPVAQVNEVLVNTTYDGLLKILREYLLSNRLFVVGDLPCLENFVTTMDILTNDSLKWTAMLLLRRKTPLFLPILVVEKTDALMDAFEKFFHPPLDRGEMESIYTMFLIATEPYCRKSKESVLFGTGDVETKVDLLIRGYLAKRIPIYTAFSTRKIAEEPVIE